MSPATQAGQKKRDMEAKASKHASKREHACARARVCVLREGTSSGRRLHESALGRAAPTGATALSLGGLPFFCGIRALRGADRGDNRTFIPARNPTGANLDSNVLNVTTVRKAAASAHLNPRTSRVLGA